MTSKLIQSETYLIDAHWLFQIFKTKKEKEKKILLINSSNL